MTPTEIILAAMKELAVPVNAGTLVEKTGLDRKVVDKAMKELKDQNLIFSPVRCKWQVK